LVVCIDDPVEFVSNPINSSNINEPNTNPKDILKIENDLNERTKMHMNTIIDSIDKQLQGRSLNTSNIFYVTCVLISVTENLENGTEKNTWSHEEIYADCRASDAYGRRRQTIER
jgi:hypothetical protein